MPGTARPGRPVHVHPRRVNGPGAQVCPGLGSRGGHRGVAPVTADLPVVVGVAEVPVADEFRCRLDRAPGPWSGRGKLSRPWCRRGRSCRRAAGPPGRRSTGRCPRRSTRRRSRRSACRPCRGRGRPERWRAAHGRGKRAPCWRCQGARVGGPCPPRSCGSSSARRGSSASTSTKTPCGLFLEVRGGQTSRLTRLEQLRNTPALTGGPDPVPDPVKECRNTPASAGRTLRHLRHFRRFSFLLPADGGCGGSAWCQPTRSSASSSSPAPD